MIIRRIKNWTEELCSYCDKHNLFIGKRPDAYTSDEAFEAFMTKNEEVFEREDENQIERFVQDLKKYDVNEKDRFGNTALYYAIDQSMGRIIEILVKNGADPNIANNNGITPMMLAASMNYPAPILSMYVYGHANPNLQNKQGETAIWLASYGCCIASVQALVMTEPDVNICDETGATPLIALCRNMANWDALSPPKEIAELLIKAGVNVYAKDKFGKSALDYAILRGDKDVVGYIKSAM